MLPQIFAQIFRQLLKPISRLIAGLLAAKVIRFFLKRWGKVKVLDAEFERDIEHWFRASLVLLLATANMEDVFFGWIPFNLQERYAWIGLGLRVLLVISVIETMPDQELYAVLHRGPPKVPFTRRFFKCCWEQRRRISSGIWHQHIKRSSPVLAILAAIFGGAIGTDAWAVGWTCYSLGISQYLYIALVTSKDKASEALQEFDDKVIEMRRELEASVEEANAKGGEG